MPKINETKCNKNWISRNHGKFNQMQKVMLWNGKKKKCKQNLPNVGKFKNSYNILCYQNPLMLLMKWIDIGKNTSQNYFFWSMVHELVSIQFVRVFFAKLCSGQIRHLINSLVVTFNYSISKKFFVKNFRPFKKHGIALLISINQYCHTVPFWFLVLLFHLFRH